MRLLSLLTLIEFIGKVSLVLQPCFFFSEVTEFVKAEIAETAEFAEFAKTRELAEFAEFAFLLSLLQVLGSNQIVVVLYKSLFLFFFGKVTELVS